ncbi:LysR family transcriptional regulator [Sphaerotilus sp.]|uniref:LysR family transcriptional regulator n=1 Tax=Sphaerotilus sp. TaxID=2093942 RepID=UPI00286DAC9A|nr:LysR family transcriptional regulator [Sphaerotilus sp.]
MDFEKLEIFVLVAECGSLSKAATLMHVGPSALSRQLAALETECGGRLLHRTGRGVALTELGQRILPNAKALLQEAERFKEGVACASSVCRGVVHIGCVATLAARLLAPVLLLARQRYPEVRLHVVTGMSGQIEQWVADGSVDLGFVIRHGTDSGLADDHLLVMSSPLCVVAAPGDRLTRTGEVAFSSLHEVPLILPGPASSRQALAEAARKRSVTLDVIAEVDSLDLMKTLVARRGGYALLLEISILDDVRAGRLSAARVVEPAMIGHVCLVHAPRKSGDRAAREIALLVREVAVDVARNGGAGLSVG